MTQSWWYGVALKQQPLYPFAIGAVYLLGGLDGIPVIVSQSFEEFLQLYVRNDPRLYLVGSREYHNRLLNEYRTQP